ncbi:peptidoglycan-binding protein [Lysobacter brunescens]|uniref:Peptidoglycan-binding protein n=1 Tax=Lysobacter brunescens TaxID=262323 RepID=A0ABW2YFC8_9GAMM
MTTLAEARQITAGGQENIANAIYGGEWGKKPGTLGNTEPGDGWRFHGRGYVQLTGRANYESVGQALGLDLVNNPDLAADREIAARIAIHYWKDRVRTQGHQLNVREATQDINGGYNHLKERGEAADAWERKFAQGYLQKLGLGETAAAIDPLSDRKLERNERGESVRKLQQDLVALGVQFKDNEGRPIPPTGFYGQQTELAVRDFQANNKLPQTGIADEATRRAIEAAARERAPSTPTTAPAPQPSTPTPTPTAAAGPQSFDDVMRIMLPPQNGTAPHMTSDFGPRTINGRADDHGGVDFNYVGGQNGVNLRHPTVHSPVSGVVEYGDGQGSYGTVKIRDDQGNLHEILHLDSRSVRVTDPPTRVEAGDPIGTMGGRGPGGSSDYAQHVHYQMRDPNGRIIDPEAFWNDRTHTRTEATPEANTTPAAERGTAPSPVTVATTPLPSEAMADGVLRRNEQGPDVGRYQRLLADLGHVGTDGKPLKVDEKFGANTEFATRQFQRDHGIDTVGVIGPKTRAALDAAGRDLVTHPDHPNNPLYERMLEQVHAAEATRGIPHGEHSRKVAAALTVEAIREGVQPDRVELSRDGSLVRAVQFSAMGDRPELNRGTDPIATGQAANQPIRESSEQAAQVANNVAAQQRDQAFTQQQSQQDAVTQAARAR